MSVETFIPEVWAKKFQDDLKRKLVFAENTNREYEGIATQILDTVKVLGLGDVDLIASGDWSSDVCSSDLS